MAGVFPPRSKSRLRRAQLLCMRQHSIRAVLPVVAANLSSGDPSGTRSFYGTLWEGAPSVRKGIGYSYHACGVGTVVLHTYHTRCTHDTGVLFVLFFKLSFRSCVVVTFVTSGPAVHSTDCKVDSRPRKLHSVCVVGALGSRAQPL